MSLCAFPGSPPLNNDIAGVGVRISIYIQSILTTIFVTVSTSPDDIYTQLFTCMVMHISIVSAALVLGTTSKPQITLQDVIATLMLLFPRSVTRVSGAGLLCLAKGSIVDPWKNVPVNVLHEIMDIISTLFAFQLLVHHRTFGSHPECNDQAKIFIFKTFKASHTWFIISFVLHAACLVLEIVWIVITFFTTLWYSRKKRVNSNAEAVDTEVVVAAFLLNIYLKGKGPEEEKNEIILTEFPKEWNNKRGVYYGKIKFIYTIFTFIVLVISIIFTELSVKANDFVASDSPNWQFGQIFPLFLLALPVISTTKVVFKKVTQKLERQPELQGHVDDNNLCECKDERHPENGQYAAV